MPEETGFDNVYVVWAVDGPVMVTRLQYPATENVRKLRARWSTDDYVHHAKDVEAIDEDAPYELCAIFEGKIEFIY